MNIKIFKNIDRISEELTSQLFQLINQSGNNRINIALSGGSTPVKFYKYLAEKNPDLSWENVHFFWGDERCVPPDHEESNYGQANQTLISKIDIPDENIHRIHGEADPLDEVQRYEKEIRRYVPANKIGIPEFDWILLGMGDDGHTASIFPDSLAEAEKKTNCLIAEHPQTGQKRISLALNIINQAHKVSFLVTGKVKAGLTARILNLDESTANLPAARIKPVTGLLEWYLDEDAASLLV